MQRTITVAAAGGPGRVFAATLLTALAVDAVLVTISTAVPALRGSYAPAAGAAGALAHIAAATTGTAVGLLCARPVVNRVGWSFCLTVTVVVITAVQPWLPPVGSAVRALTTGAALPIVEAALGLTLAACAGTVAWLVDRRR